MRVTRTLVLLLLGTGMAAGALSITVNSLSRSQVFKGCTGIAGDGSVDPAATMAFWNNSPITPQTAFADSLTDSAKKVLGATTDAKWIEVDLSEQKLIAHQGDTVFLESLISSGLWGKTPAGEYNIWYKIRATKMEGGNKLNNTYYYLPNVPYAMFFYGDFGIHGTYWHQNFGQPMSHGCVNAPTTVAEKLFYWADPQIPDGKFAVRATSGNPGTKVVIHQ